MVFSVVHRNNVDSKDVNDPVQVKVYAIDALQNKMSKYMTLVSFAGAFRPTPIIAEPSLAAGT